MSDTKAEDFDQKKEKDYEANAEAAIEEFISEDYYVNKRIINFLKVSRKSNNVKKWEKPILLGLFLLSSWLNFYQIDSKNIPDIYYAHAVKSMLVNWHNFFYGAFDITGYSSLDKIPGAYWIQALSAKIFGFNKFSLLLPQALTGVLGPFFLYDLVRRYYSILAAFLATLILIITPINIAVQRTNLSDGLLLFTTLLAVWCFEKAYCKVNFKWLIITFILVGVGFNIKMLEAYLILPFFYLFYLFGNKAKLVFVKKLLHIVISSIFLLIISLWWIVIVDLTPKHQRPFIDSTITNSATELLIYNGLSRIWPNLQPQQVGVNFNNNSMQELVGISTPGPARFFIASFNTEISWLLCLALLGIILSGIFKKFITISVTKTQFNFFTFSFAVLLFQLIFFSSISFFYVHYLAIIAWSLASVAGIITAQLIKYYHIALEKKEIRQKSDWIKGVLFPLLVFITGCVQIEFVNNYPTWAQYLTTLLLFGSLASCSMLLLFLFNFDNVILKSIIKYPKQLHNLITGCAVATLLICPLLWSVSPTLGYISATPRANPRQINYKIEDKPIFLNPLLNYLITNRVKTTFLVMSLDYYHAALIGLNSSETVATMGGYAGDVRIPSQLELTRLVTQNKSRFFIIPNDQLPVKIADWFEANCSLVKDFSVSNKYTTQSRQFQIITGPHGYYNLYDCIRSKGIT